MSRDSGHQLVLGALRIYFLDLVVLYVSTQAGHLRGNVRQREQELIAHRLQLGSEAESPIVGYANSNPKPSYGPMTHESTSQQVPRERQLRSVIGRAGRSAR